ncbi:MAG: hypothetical protein HYZ74_05945 [Elusimicrobia bacterium]|nr:hypothetical protein [Elusimicrobiota bacterium]
MSWRPRKGSWSPRPEGALKRELLLLLLIAASAACAGGPRGSRAALTRFPIGIYQVDEPRHLARLKEDGFDAFLPYADDPATLSALAQEARRVGMRMIAVPDKLREAGVSTKGWPVDAWYLFDEPDVHRLSSAALQGLSDKTRAWDPERPQTFVIGQGAPARLYAGVADVMMMDWYPIPHRTAESVAEQIDLVVSVLPAGKPFWMVVQAYDWADQITDPEKLKKGLRFPTRAEIRFMSYVSVLHGARGLFYFALTKKKKTLFDYPELWQAVSGVTREMRRMQPIFERGRGIPLPFAIPTGGLEAGAWRHRGRDYVVLVNRRARRDWRVPAEILDGRWRARFASADDPKALLRRFGSAYYLRAQDVLVLESR